MSWGYHHFEVRCPGHSFCLFGGFQALLPLLSSSGWDLCEQSNLTAVDRLGYRKRACERVSIMTKNYRAATFSVMQHKILSVEAETVHEATAVWGCAGRSPATFSDNVARIWDSKRTVSVKEGLHIKGGKERKKEEGRKKSQENSQSLVLFLGIRGTGMTSPAAYQSSSALFRFRSHVIIADVAQK